MKVHKTSKLFYRKYPYKIELCLKGAEYVKRNSHDELVKLFTGSNLPYFIRYKSFTDAQKQKLIEFSTIVKPIMERGHKVRTEMDTISFYLNDETEYNGLVTELNPYIRSVTIPESEKDLEKLFSKNHIIMCDKLPHGKYEYKLVIRPNLSDATKESIFKWLETTTDEVRVPEKTRYWLQGHQKWIYDPFLYVTSSKHLTMLGLFLGNSVKKTYEYVLRDTQINSVSEDNTCQP